MSDHANTSDIPTLPDWRTVVTLLNDSAVEYSETFSFQDALVAAPTGDGKYLITSPNMGYIPAPAWGQLNVTLKADGKCGMEDPIQWPQICVEDSRWISLACIRRPSCGPRDHQHWRLPIRGEPGAPGDLVRAVEGFQDLYKLSKARLQPLREMLRSSGDDIEVFESSKGSSSYLRWLQLNAKNALDCLEVPATERDIVRQLAVAERFWCMISAWLTYQDLFCNLTAASAPREVDRTLMGCFTTSPKVVGEFYHAGVPVWHMRLMHTLSPAIRVRSVTTLQLPDNIVVTSGPFGSRPVYQGLPGKAQFEAIIFGSNQYIDIEPLPFPASYTSSNAARDAGRAVAPLIGQTSATSSSAGPSRITTSASKKKKKQAQKQKAIPYYRPALPQSDPHTINKFGDPSSEFIPPLLDGWQAALNHGVNEVKTNHDSWQLWVPEPHMVCGSSSADRRRRYVLNWLRLREVWFTNLRDPNSRQSMMSRWWRAFLDDGFEPSRGDHEAVRQKALAVITSLSGYSAFDPVALSPTWFGQLITTVDTALCQMVAWEISEMGFRVELVLLDLVFLQAEAGETKIQPTVAAERQLLLNQIFPATSPLCISSLPTTDTGLASPNAAERRPCVEALRCLMKSWPGCPSPLCDCPSLAHATENALLTAELLIKRFYVETFVKVANRPPILPRRLPAMSPLLNSVPRGLQSAQPTPTPPPPPPPLPSPPSPPPPPPPPSAESPPSTPSPPLSPLSRLPPLLPSASSSTLPLSPPTDFLPVPTPIAGRDPLSLPSPRSDPPVSTIANTFAHTRSSSPIPQGMLEYREVTPCPPTPPRLGSESPPFFPSLDYSTTDYSTTDYSTTF